MNQKKIIAFAIWLLLAIIIVFSLIQMFSSDFWYVYAIIVGVCFYLTRRIFWQYLISK